MKSWACLFSPQNARCSCVWRKFHILTARVYWAKRGNQKNLSRKKKRIPKFEKRKTDGVNLSLNPFCYLKYTFTETEDHWGRGKILAGKDSCPCLFSGAAVSMGRVDMEMGDNDTVRVLLHNGHLVDNSRHSLLILPVQDPGFWVPWGRCRCFKKHENHPVPSHPENPHMNSQVWF